MANKITLPSITETAFNCPHCGAFTSQLWFGLHAETIRNEQRTPRIPSKAWKEKIQSIKEIEKDAKSMLFDWYDKMESGHVFLEYMKDAAYLHSLANNIFLSQCYNCEKVAVWVHKSMVFPHHRTGVEPNVDLPDEIIRDFEEARSILNLSPRGAAALLRLCVQKLCVHLGEKGKKIDEDIANLVAKGLNPLVQKSLDIVRVIGNEAVHPGVLALKDDPDTAIKLLGLVNLIADQMISHPKAVKQLYDEKIPDSKKQAIETRNEKALKDAKP